MIQTSARLLPAAMVALVATIAAAASLPEARRFGIASLEGDGTGCALVADPSLPLGEPLAVIVTGGPRHQLARAEIAGAPDEPCAGMPPGWREAGDTLYRLRVTGVGNSLFAAGTLVRFPPKRLRIDRNGHATGADRQGAPPLVFSDCASSEGAHLFVWSGAVGAGRPLWYRYVYLGYDTVVTCADISAAGPRPR